MNGWDVHIDSGASDPIWMSGTSGASIAEEPDLSELLKAQATRVKSALEEMGATSEQAMAIIMAEIASSDDVRATASEWLAAFTRQVMDVVEGVEADAAR